MGGAIRLKARGQLKYSPNSAAFVLLVQSPGEIKWRDVSWTLPKKVRLIWGSRRDQDEGGELDSHEESETDLRVQARSR